MKISDYFNYIFKNKIAFIIYPILISLVLTSSYHFFKNNIKYLETSSQIYSEYEVIDLLNENTNNIFYISAHDLILDAERMLVMTLSQNLAFQDKANGVDLVQQFLSYKITSDVFFKKGALDIIRKNKFSSKYFITNSKLVEGRLDSKILFTLKHPYNQNPDGDIDSYLSKINQELENDFLNIQNLHKKFIQVNLTRYFQKISYLLQDNPKILNKYKTYLFKNGGELLLEDTETFKLRDDFFTLEIIKVYEEKRIFPMPSLLLILVISYILGFVLTFIFSGYRNKTQNLSN